MKQVGQSRVRQASSTLFADQSGSTGTQVVMRLIRPPGGGAIRFCDEMKRSPPPGGLVNPVKSG